MMKLFLALIFFLPALSDAKTPRAATGVEAGVSRLSHDDKTLVGTSWVYHFEYRPGPLLGFFGQTGQAQAEDGSRKFQETQFSGGLLVPVLEILSLNVGLSNTLVVIKDSGDEDRYHSLAPLAGMFIHSEFGAFSVRASATVIRSQEITSTALRMGLVLQF